jgi:hypothetical protein
LLLAPLGEQPPNAIPEDGEPAMEGVESADLEREAAETPPVRIRKAPNEPTRLERELHEALHEPYRSWCRACVSGRGRADRHAVRPEEKDFPIVGVDYGYMYNRAPEQEPVEGDDGEPPAGFAHSNPILAGRNSRDHWIFGHLLERKGDTAWNREVLAKEILDGGYKRQILRRDGEPALRSHVERATQQAMLDNEAAEMLCEVTQKGDSASTDWLREP